MHKKAIPAQYNAMNKKKIFNWIELTAFALLLLGGMNFLLMGLFGFDMFASIFGGAGSVTSRIFYSLFGISAAFLVATILWKAFMVKKPAVKAAPSPKTASK